LTGPPAHRLRFRDSLAERDRRPPHRDVGSLRHFRRAATHPVQSSRCLIPLASADAVRAVLLEQAEQVAARLRKQTLKARTVTVKIRFGDFQTITRRCTLEEPSDTTSDIWRAAREQFERWASEQFRPVRLIGVSAGGFADAGQLDLFVNPTTERQRRLDQAVDKINTKFGSKIGRGKPGVE
jgi:hypothetical protein